MNFKPIGETLKGLKGRNSLMFNHVLNLSSKRKKNGDNIFYIASIAVDDKQVEFSKKDFPFSGLHKWRCLCENTTHKQQQLLFSQCSKPFLQSISFTRFLTIALTVGVQSALKHFVLPNVYFPIF